MELELRAACLELLALADPVAKAAAVSALERTGPIDCARVFAEPPGVPGRSERPPLWPHTRIKPGSLATARGHAALVHSIVHIERNA
ncbi:MAG: DUF455 domain-containing protein, partial [Curvibacter sp.]